MAPVEIGRDSVKQVPVIGLPDFSLRGRGYRLVEAEDAPEEVRVGASEEILQRGW